MKKVLKLDVLISSLGRPNADKHLRVMSPNMCCSSLM